MQFAGSGGGGGGGRDRNDPESAEDVVVLCFFIYFFFLFSPSYSSVPTVHLITTVLYITVVRTRECLGERGWGVNALL